MAPKLQCSQKNFFTSFGIAKGSVKITHVHIAKLCGAANFCVTCAIGLSSYNITRPSIF
jgi:hypothetical protein